MPQRQGTRYISPEIGAMNTLNSFAQGISNAMAMQQSFETQRAKVKDMEKRTGIAEEEAKWRAEERDRLLIKEQATRQAIGSLSGKFSRLSRDAQKDKSASAANILFQTMQEFPNADIGTMSQFGGTVADWLFPDKKRDLHVKTMEHADGSVTTEIIDLEDGGVVHSYTSKETPDVSQAKLTEIAQDRLEMFMSVEETYRDVRDDAIQDRIKTNKAIAGAPLITDGTLNNEQRQAEMEAIYANVAASVEKEIGSLHDFALKRLGKAWGHEEAKGYLAGMNITPPPPVKRDKQFYKDAFSDQIGKRGWNVQTIRQMGNFIRSLGGPAERAEAAAARAEIYKEQGLWENPPDDPENFEEQAWQRMSPTERMGPSNRNVANIMGLSGKPRERDDMGNLNPLEKMYRSMQETVGVPVSEMDPNAGPGGRAGIPKKRPKQMYFDIQRQMKNQFPDLFKRQTEEKFRREGEELMSAYSPTEER